MVFHLGLSTANFEYIITRKFLSASRDFDRRGLNHRGVFYGRFLKFYHVISADEDAGPKTYTHLMDSTRVQNYPYLNAGLGN
jgi:hypothetical protein